MKNSQDMHNGCRCFYIENLPVEEDTITIGSQKAGHIANVLRLGPGDYLILFDRNAYSCRGLITDVERNSIKIKIEERFQADIKANKTIVLGQAVPKGKKMDLIVQKSTELGVTSILPFFSSRCVPRWDGLKYAKKIDHWNKVAVAAVEQSGIRRIPLVEDIRDFQSLCSNKDYDGYLKLIFWEEEKKSNLKKILSSKPVPDKILFLVGPEGGFSCEEVNFAEKKGFIPVSIGKSILRTETMCFAALAIIQYEHGELG